MADKIWNGPNARDKWSVANNWLPVGVPTSGVDRVIFDGRGGNQGTNTESWNDIDNFTVEGLITQGVYNQRISNISTTPLTIHGDLTLLTNVILNAPGGGFPASSIVMSKDLSTFTFTGAALGFGIFNLGNANTRINWNIAGTTPPQLVGAIVNF